MSGARSCRPLRVKNRSRRASGQRSLRKSTQRTPRQPTRRAYRHRRCRRSTWISSGGDGRASSHGSARLRGRVEGEPLRHVANTRGYAHRASGIARRRNAEPVRLPTGALPDLTPVSSSTAGVDLPPALPAVRRMRRARVVSCLASSTQQMNSLRAGALCPSKRQTRPCRWRAESCAGPRCSSCTTPPGTALARSHACPRAEVGGSLVADAPRAGVAAEESSARCREAMPVDDRAHSRGDLVARGSGRGGARASDR